MGPEFCNSHEGDLANKTGKTCQFISGQDSIAEKLYLTLR